MQPARDTAVRRLARRVNAVGSVVRHPLAFDRHRRQLEVENQQLREVYESWVPPGHFYSPFPDLDDYECRVTDLRDTHRDVVGIDLRESRAARPGRGHRALVADIAFPEQPDPGGATRYWFDNPAYAYGDGAVLHGMLRHLRPRRVVEVGSGYFIGQDPQHRGRVAERHRADVHRTPSRARARSAPTGSRDPSDHPRGRGTGRVAGRLRPARVRRRALRRLDSRGQGRLRRQPPRLRGAAAAEVGVWVHLHDIFFPFEYPEAWVREGRAWHEAYLVRAFLAFNPAFEIRWFQDFLWSRHRERLERIPWVAKNRGANHWLEKVR